MPGPTANSFLADFNAWGPPFWKVAHTITFMYPESNPSREDQQRVIDFFKMFPTTLPCSICGAHFLETVATSHPLNNAALQSRETLTRWLVDLHNTVNRRLNKPEVAYETVVRYYTQNCREPLRKTEETCSTSERDGYMIAMIVVILVFVFSGIGTFVAIAKHPKFKSRV